MRRHRSLIGDDQLMRIFITGGSGFIGTNLVQYFSERGHEVANFDELPPRNPLHNSFWRQGDLRHASDISRAMAEFAPEAILHMGARTDLEGRTIDDYSANVAGVANLLKAAISGSSVRRVLFASSMLVCRLGYSPRSDVDYCPNTIYGESKVAGEQIIRTAGALPFTWSILRPTSIWGPWFGSPYRSFFNTVRAGAYVHPRGLHTSRTYGFVLNAVKQIAAIVECDPALTHERTFYIGDYEPLDLKQWADTINQAFRQRPVRQVPRWVMNLGAFAGDLAKLAGMKNPPLTSFRLQNLVTPAVMNLTNIRQICPQLPYDMEAGVKLTIEWMEQQSRRSPQPQA